MNHRPPVLETVKAIQGFLQFKSAEGLSPRTIESYSRDLMQWHQYLGRWMFPKLLPSKYASTSLIY